MRSYLRVCVLSALLSCLGADRLPAQMQGEARLEGEMLPIVSVNERYYQVLRNGSKQRAENMEYKMVQAEEFADGFVEVKDIVADFDPLKNAPAKERTDPSAVRFKYKAKLVSDRNLSDCYGLLTLIADGSVGTHVFHIGRLSKGSPEPVEISVYSRVNAVGSLHVFSNTKEVRSTHHPEPYKMHDYLSGLVKDIKAIPAAELVRLKRVYQHELSPDGRFVATLREGSGKQYLMVYDLTNMAQLCQTRVADEEAYAGGIVWISDNEIAYVAEDDIEFHRGERRLHQLDIKAGKTRMLLENVFSARRIPDRQGVLLLTYFNNGFSFIKYDVRTGKTLDHDEPFNGGYLFDRSGEARVRIMFDEDKVSYELRPVPGGRWVDADSLVKQPGMKFSLRGEEFLDRKIEIHSVGPDGDTLYVSSRLGSDCFELAAFSMSKGVITKTIAKHPKYDLTTDDGGVAHLLFAKRTPELLGMVYGAQKPRVLWLHPAYASVQKNMDATFPDNVNLPMDWSDDGSTFIYVSYSDQDPGTMYAFRVATGELIPLLQLGKRLANKTLAKTTPFEFAARDGQKVPAYLTKPSTGGKGLPPLLVWVHGGPMVRDGWGFDPLNQYFASRGYAVLQVNYRGSSGYGAAFQAAGLRTRLDTVVIDDIADGVRHLIEKGEVDPKRIAIGGGSFGGWATYISLAKYPDLYRAGVAMAAVSHWRRALNDARWEFDNQVSYRVWKSILKRGNFSEDEKFIDPYVRAAEIKQPVFIVHGERDNIVHAREAGMMLAALKKHNANIESRSFLWATHSWWSETDRVEMMNDTAGFLERHLGRNEEPEAVAEGAKSAAPTASAP